MKRKHNVVMLPTEKADFKGLILDIRNKPELKLNFNPRFNLDVNSYGGLGEVNFKPQHLYFTSIDEEIKEGDWFIRVTPNLTHVCQTNQSDITVEIANAFKYRKIVATTNPELWERFDFQAYRSGTGYKQTNVPTGIGKIGVDFIEAYVKQYNSGTPINEVYLEIQQYDVKGRKTDTEHIDNLYSTKLKLRNNGTGIISPVDERKYTREEVLETIKDSIYIGMSSAYEHDTSTEALERGIKLFNKKYPQ